MAPIQYTGALASKKKSELQEIALALGLADVGTKADLELKIRKHLDEHQDSLEENPIFAGLYGRRRKASVQPINRVEPPRPIKESPASSRSQRRTNVLEQIRESTPSSDNEEPSALPPTSPSPIKSSSPLRHVPELASAPVSAELPAVAPVTPISLPPLSMNPEAISALTDLIPRPDVSSIVATVDKPTKQLMSSGAESIANTRQFLSNSRNIWSLTAVGELLYILYAVIPWTSTVLSLPGVDFHIPHPVWKVFATSVFYSVLFHWALPAVIIPSAAGYLISFDPAIPSHRNFDVLSPPQASFDPLTASIIRLAAQIAYPFSSLEQRIVGIDVLGQRWRVLDAAVGVAFAFAEIIKRAPHANHEVQAAPEGGDIDGTLMVVEKTTIEEVD